METQNVLHTPVVPALARLYSPIDILRRLIVRIAKYYSKYAFYPVTIRERTKISGLNTKALFDEANILDPLQVNVQPRLRA